MDEVIKKLSVPGRAFGFNINIGSIREHRLINVEVAPNQISIKHVSMGNYSHFNMYRHMEISQRVDVSSIHRLDRSWQLPAPDDPRSVVTILGDNADHQYPIYRDSVAPDGCSTVCTALFDFQQQQMLLYLQNPKYATPYLKLPLYV